MKDTNVGLLLHAKLKPGNSGGNIRRSCTGCETRQKPEDIRALDIRAKGHAAQGHKGRKNVNR